MHVAQSPPPRRGYLDWLRGLAGVIMIEAHILDSWTRLDQRDSSLFGASIIVGGFGAPLFLFLAGVAVSLSAGSKFRRLDSRSPGDSGSAPSAAGPTVSSHPVLLSITGVRPFSRPGSQTCLNLIP